MALTNPTKGSRLQSDGSRQEIGLHFLLLATHYLLLFYNNIRLWTLKHILIFHSGFHLYFTENLSAWLYNPGV